MLVGWRLAPKEPPQIYPTSGTYFADRCSARTCVLLSNSYSVENYLRMITWMVMVGSRDQSRAPSRGRSQLLTTATHVIIRTITCNTMPDWRHHPYHHSPCEIGPVLFRSRSLGLLTLRSTAILGRGIQRTLNALFSFFREKKCPRC